MNGDVGDDGQMTVNLIWDHNVKLEKGQYMWDERYSEQGYAYGTEANEFLASVAEEIPPGKVLCLGAGEGRNAVFLAEQGFDVTAVDLSSVGLHKAELLAAEHEVQINTICANLKDFTIEPNTWSGIISIFCHLPSKLRKQIHKQCVEGLAPDGVFLLEGYTPNQLNYNTGGPEKKELLMNLDELEEELSGLSFKIGQEVERPVVEGRYHTGMAAVVGILAVKES